MYKVLFAVSGELVIYSEDQDIEVLRTRAWTFLEVVIVLITVKSDFLGSL